MSASKPLKKRKHSENDKSEEESESDYNTNDDTEDDDHDLLNESPVFRRRPATKGRDKSTATALQVEAKPQRKSPRTYHRRSPSIETLDAATSSPSFVKGMFSSQGTQSAASPRRHDDQDAVILLTDDDDNDKDESTSKSSARGQTRDSLSNLPASGELDNSTPFTLSKAPSITNKAKDETFKAQKKKSPETDADNEKANLTTTTATATHTKTTTRVSLSQEQSKVDSTLTKQSSAMPTKSKQKSSKTSRQTKDSSDSAGAAAKENAINMPDTAPTKETMKKKKKKRDSTAVSTDVDSSLQKSTPPTKTAPINSDQNTGSTKSSAVVSESKPKKKKKKLNFQDLVFRHMFCSMKPFTLKSLAGELQSTDAQLNYVMLSLIDKGLVVKKDFTSSKGRTKTLYWAVDGVKSKEVTATHTATPAERTAAQQQLQAMQTQLATLRKTMVDLQSDLSNQEIELRLQQEEGTRNELYQQVSAIRARIQAPPAKPKLGLASFKSKTTPANPHQLKLRINHMREEWKKRKQKCMDFCYQLSDAMEKKPKDVLKLLDVETDEMCGASLPAKYVVEMPASKTKR